MTTHTNTDRPTCAPIIALAIAIMLSFGVIGVMIESPATIPTWCTTYGCP